MHHGARGLGKLAALVSSAGLLAFLIVHSQRSVDPPAPLPIRAAPAKTTPAQKPASPIGRPFSGSKADPHLARMLAEEASARPGILGPLEDGQVAARADMKPGTGPR